MESGNKMRSKTLKKLIKIKQYIHKTGRLSWLEQKTRQVILEERPFTSIEDIFRHKSRWLKRRLTIFRTKGIQCTCCGVIATRVIKGINPSGGKYGSSHVNLYTNDGLLITVDHIIPLSKGGPDTLENKQPMCCICNGKKGNQ